MLIGIHGRIGAGKDTVGKILQWLNSKDIGMSFKKGMLFSDVNINSYLDTSFRVKKFAYNVKYICALLIGCTIDDLENQSFKDQELGEEWWYWQGPEFKIPYLQDPKFDLIDLPIKLVKPTVRLMLQRIGTEAMRNQIHSDVWVNSLLKDYKVDSKGVLPDWLITDLRFPNEAKAIKDRDGILIKVVRHTSNPENEHESEKALDDFHDWDFIIENKSSKEDLINQVKSINQQILKR